MKILHFIPLLFLFFSQCHSLANQSVFFTKEGVIRGYDPVSYFQNQPVKGKRSISLQYKGGTWFFASENNKLLFEKNPEKFSPQYGGFCAYAMRDGNKYEIDPLAWTMHGGKLYLNISKKVNGFWQRNLEENIQKSDRQWDKLQQ